MMKISHANVVSLLYCFVLIQAALLLGLACLIVLFRAIRTRRERGSDLETARIRNLIFRVIMTPGDRSDLEISKSAERHALDALQAIVQTLDSSHHDRIRDLIRRSDLKIFLAERLRSRVWWKRLSAVRILHFLPMDEFKPDVIRLQQDPQPLVRLEAIRAVSGFGEKELAQVISRWPEIGWMLDHHPIDEMQERFGGPPILELEELIRHDDHPDVLVRLVQLVPRLGGSTEFLMEMASHAEIRVRLAAIKVMAQVPSDEVRRELMVCLEDKDWRVRALAARSLADHGNPDTIRSISPLLLDRDPRVKMSAAFALKKLGGAGVSVLRYMSRRSRSPEHRRLFAQVLGLPER